MASSVFTMDSRSLSTQTGYVPQTLQLFNAAGYSELIKPGDTVAVKIHCGEWNNTAYLRPVYARAICDHIRSLGGKPFVCDTTTLTYGPYAAQFRKFPSQMVAAQAVLSSAFAAPLGSNRLFPAS